MVYQKKKLKTKIFGPGKYLTIEPKNIHRMEAIQNTLYIEASTPEILDVVRIEDDYKRN